MTKKILVQRRRAEMKVILSVIFLALSLLYGVQGEAQCVKNEDEDSFCGCQLQGESGNAIIKIALDFVDIR